MPWPPGKLWFRVPETLRFEFTGDLMASVSWKDVILHLAGRFGADAAQYRSMEFGGPAAANADMSSPPHRGQHGRGDGGQVRNVRGRRRHRQLSPRARRRGQRPFGPDADASYAEVHEIHLSDLSPQVALPHEIDRVSPIEEVAGITINQCFLGSCTNGRIEDLEAAAEIVAGKQIAPGIRLLVAPASRRVLQEATRSGSARVAHPGRRHRHGPWLWALLRRTRRPAGARRALHRHPQSEFPRPNGKRAG